MTRRMTLESWAARWPYTLAPVVPWNPATGRLADTPVSGLMVTQDVPDHEYRPWAWSLSDAKVLGVSAGSIWLALGDFHAPDLPEVWHFNGSSVRVEREFLEGESPALWQYSDGLDGARAVCWACGEPWLIVRHSEDTNDRPYRVFDRNEVGLTPDGRGIRCHLCKKERYE